MSANPSTPEVTRALKPCPFCGSENVASSLQVEDGGYRGSIQCGSCWARGPRTYIGDWADVLCRSASGKRDSRDEIGASSWNTRTPARGGDELREALEKIANYPEGNWHGDTVAMRNIARAALPSTDMAGAGEGKDANGNVDARSGALTGVRQPDAVAHGYGQPGGVAREAVARIIDPDAFHCHQGVYDHSLRLAYTEAEAKQRADEMHGADCDAARAKADEVLAAITPPNHIIDASKHLRRIYDALPKRSRCRDCADGDGIRCLNDDRLCNPTDWVIELLAAAKNKGN